MLLSELLAGLAAKLAGLGLATKAALGLGIAATAVTGAGAANVLPDPAQHAVASVVNAVSPLQLQDPNLSVNIDTSSKLSTPGSLLESGDEEGEEGGERNDNHGACVSAVAHDTSAVGREHGLAVSTAAQSDCGKEDKGASTSTSSTTTTSTTLGGLTSSAELNDSKNKGKSEENKPDTSENKGQGSSNSGRGNSGK